MSRCSSAWSPALESREDLEEAGERATEAMARSPREGDGSLLDVDVVVRSWCEARGIAIPVGVMDRVALHIRALEESIGGDAG